MKTEMKHTPGPWRISTALGNDGGGSYRHEIDPCGVTIYQHLLGRTVPEIQANARLIAAAPEMLEALKATWEFWCGGDAPKEIENMIVSAIAKAEGSDK